MLFICWQVESAIDFEQIAGSSVSSQAKCGQCSNLANVGFDRSGIVRLFEKSCPSALQKQEAWRKMSFGLRLLHRLTPRLTRAPGLKRRSTQSPRPFNGNHIRSLAGSRRNWVRLAQETHLVALLPAEGRKRAMSIRKPHVS